MFCPNCGTKGDNKAQYCRSCGDDLGVVRAVANDTESRVTAKQQIGAAYANRIDAVTSAKELKKITHEVLPNIEKFLESPAEKRLRRIRKGSITTFVGLGAAIGFLIAASMGEEELIVVAAMGLITFFIGIAFMINGWFFTTRKSELSEKTFPKELEGYDRNTNELLMPQPAKGDFRSSVTENTTRTLDNKLPVENKRK